MKFLLLSSPNNVAGKAIVYKDENVMLICSQEAREAVMLLENSEKLQVERGYFALGKHFNTEGLCYPEDHYMVRMEERLQKMEEYVEQGKYFTINRGRQYGKTTMLNLLAGKLSEQYAVFLISFEGMEDEVIETASSFCKRICKLLYRSVRY